MPRGYFWTNAGLEPKRAFRFKVSIGAFEAGVASDGQWMAKSVTKPAVTVGETPHKFLNHTFYYPGQVTWNTCTIVLVDPAYPDATHALLGTLNKSGYAIPRDNMNSPMTTIGKGSAVGNLNNIVIRALDAEGNDLEKWTLKNPWIKNISFNDYSYESEELATVTLEVRYDWARYEVTGPETHTRIAVDGVDDTLF